MKDWPFYLYPPLFGQNPLWPPQGGMSVGATDDGRTVRLPFGMPPETQKLATFGAPNGVGYTNVPTIYGGVPVSDEYARQISRGGFDPDTGLGFQSFGSIGSAERDARARSQGRDPELLRKFPWLFGR